jgi:hypothetical protein
MPQVIQIETDVLEVLSQFDQMTEGEGMAKLVKEHARLLCVQLAYHTQPFAVGSNKDEQKKAYNQGSKRVEFDIEKVIRGGKKLEEIAEKIVNEDIQKRMLELIAQKKWDAVGKILAATKIIKAWDGKFEILKTPGAMKSVHSRARNKRSGRTKTPRDALYIAATDAKLATYVRQASQRVGFAKAGWADCARKLNAVKGDGARGIPAWAKKAKHGNNGSVIDLSGDKSNPRVALTNRVSYITNILTKMDVEKSIKFTTTNFIKSLERKVNAAIKKQRLAEQQVDEPF